jgi:CRISPR-associated protein Csh1
LYEFGNVLPRKSLPNPLPIFIYSNELKDDLIALCKENEGRISYREIIEILYQSHKQDFQNYYLLNWSNTQNGIVFNDFDFVSKFEYELKGWEIQNHFELYKKDKGKQLKHYPPISTIFELEDRVLKYLIQNKYHRVDYFSDFKKEDYDNRDMTFLSFCKYRKEFMTMSINQIETPLEVKNLTNWFLME